MSEGFSIQYAGDSGVTRACQDAVTRILQHGDAIEYTTILSREGDHGLFLRLATGEYVAVKTGFASGYHGEGPRRFAYTLQLLDFHGVELREFSMSRAMTDRLNRCSLTQQDVVDILQGYRFAKWHQYSDLAHAFCANDGELWKTEGYPLVVPLGLIDPRIADLALAFWDNPDDRILKAFRRLEDIIRNRIDASDHGTKLFRKAFLDEPVCLKWPSLGPGEQASRAQLFSATYSAFRNPRAHKELTCGRSEQLSEFLAVNHLYLLEGTAVKEQGHQLP